MNTRMLQIQIDSNKRFPSCGSVGSYDFILEHTLGTCPGKEQTASPGTSAGDGPSWSKTLSTKSRWPSLGTISSTNAFEPLASSHVASGDGLKNVRCPSVERRRSSGSIVAVEADD
uniref:(northern house mosquito) hypothetical protein n=2 Tax=Culex pipiens TaxID=7175 RepID=A0A8D8AV94_CULPI